MSEGSAREQQTATTRVAQVKIVLQNHMTNENEEIAASSCTDLFGRLAETNANYL